MADYGKEFMGAFIVFMKKNRVKIQRSLNKKKVAFVERFNQTLSKSLFAHQYNEEMKTRRDNREWVVRLSGVIESLNNDETRMIDMKPKDAIKLESVKQPEYEPDQIPDELPFDSLVRYLYKPGEESGDNKYRATDPIWSVFHYEIYEIVPVSEQPSLYVLWDAENKEVFEDGRTFTREQLQVIPNDTDFE